MQLLCFQQTDLTTLYVSLYSLSVLTSSFESRNCTDKICWWFCSIVQISCSLHEAQSFQAKLTDSLLHNLLILWKTEVYQSLTTPCHFSLIWDTLIQSTTSPHNHHTLHLPVSLLKIIPNILRYSKLSLSFTFPHQNSLRILYSRLHVRHSSQLILLDFITQIIYTARKRNNAIEHHAVFYSFLHFPSLSPEYLPQYTVFQINITIRII